MGCEEDLTQVCMISEQIFGITKDILSVPCSKITALCLDIRFICLGLTQSSGNGPMSCEEKLAAVCELNQQIKELADDCHSDIMPLCLQIEDICSA